MDEKEEFFHSKCDGIPLTVISTGLVTLSIQNRPVIQDFPIVPFHSTDLKQLVPDDVIFITQNNRSTYISGKIFSAIPTPEDILACIYAHKDKNPTIKYILNYIVNTKADVLINKKVCAFSQIKHLISDKKIYNINWIQSPKDISDRLDQEKCSDTLSQWAPTAIQYLLKWIDSSKIEKPKRLFNTYNPNTGCSFTCTFLSNYLTSYFCTKYNKYISFPPPNLPPLRCLKCRNDKTLNFSF